MRSILFLNIVSLLLFFVFAYYMPRYEKLFVLDFLIFPLVFTETFGSVVCFLSFFNILYSYLKHFYVPFFLVLFSSIPIKHVLSLFVFMIDLR